jgi:hypothetical protein
MEQIMSDINLYRHNPDISEEEFVGTFTENQLDFLIDNLEEDFEEDEEYLINQKTINALKNRGADKKLISLLEEAMTGMQADVEVFYRYA